MPHRIRLGPLWKLRALAALFAFAAIGTACRKASDRPKSEDRPSSATPGKSGDPADDAPPATYPDSYGGRIARALDLTVAAASERTPTVTAEVRFKDLEREIAAFPKRVLKEEKAKSKILKPATTYGAATDESQDRKLLDASFTRLSKAWRSFPERLRERSVALQRDAFVRNKGATPEQGLALAESLYPSLRVRNVYDPNEQISLGNDQPWVRASIPRGRSAAWAGIAFLGCEGTVVLDESLKIEALNNVWSVVEGAVGELIVKPSMLSGYWAIVDASKLTVPHIVVSGDCILRLGPSTHRVSITGARYCLILCPHSDLEVRDADRSPGRDSGSPPAILMY
jgi:hypothetical protein